MLQWVSASRFRILAAVQSTSEDSLGAAWENAPCHGKESRAQGPHGLSGGIRVAWVHGILPRSPVFRFLLRRILGRRPERVDHRDCPARLLGARTLQPA